MLLVPGELRRMNLTGDVPYYGGRFTPAQAYAASHPKRPPDGRIQALQHLRDTGVITPEEFAAFRSRVTS